MTPRRQRLAVVAVVVAGASLATYFGLQAFKENLYFFLDPSQIAAGEAPPGGRITLGGMVADDSVTREPGSMLVNFVVTDFENNVTVSYEGLLPDLFREGQGVVVKGRIGADGGFVADTVLAKHDENYMPPEAAKAIAGKRRNLDTLVQ